MSKIHVLYVGNDDWTTKYSIPDNIEFEVYESDESEPSTNRPARKLMDLVILDRDITLSEEKKFTKFTRGYCLFATENVQMLNSATSRYFKARMGQYLYTGDVQYFLAHEVRNYYPNPYGEKFNPAKLAISDSFTGRVSCEGNYNLLLEGEFGEDFSQIAYWRYNIPVFEGQCIDMYLEYEKTGDVEIKLRLFQFYYGSIGDIKQVWELDEEQLQDVFCIDNESDQGPVFVSILARGTGSLNIISLHDRHSRRGHGFFLPGGERLSEHYNRYGAIFCHTVFNKKGQKALRKFFDVTGREMIVENFVTGDILVRWQDKDWIFRSKTDFIAFFIRCAGLEDTAVYFNSLSYPFFASQALAPNGFRDALFWHEPVGDEIPGNMQIILHDQGTRAKRVFVSRRESYDRLIALGAPSDKVKQLGYIYSFVRENKHRPHILVCTNSENVGHLTELASLMPQMHFHVAAITEMSSKLMSAGQYDNVSLYPNVKMSVLDSLFEKCDFYLDINHEGEIVDAVHRAFLNNMLIVGYEETMHNAYYTADTNTFKESEYADMAEALNLTLAMPHLIDEALAMQKKAAVAADATDYMEILHL